MKPQMRRSIGLSNNRYFAKFLIQLRSLTSHCLPSASGFVSLIPLSVSPQFHDIEEFHLIGMASERGNGLSRRGEEEGFDGMAAQRRRHCELRRMLCPTPSLAPSLSLSERFSSYCGSPSSSPAARTRTPRANSVPPSIKRADRLPRPHRWGKSCFLFGGMPRKAASKSEPREGGRRLRWRNRRPRPFLRSLLSHIPRGPSLSL